MQPQITIAMATCQGASYLPDQLDSILRQSWRRWRILVSDDGSTDATRAIIAEHARRLPGRIALIEGPRRGATANFLHLLDEAQGDDWLAFCDQDDVWKPDKLERAAAYLSAQRGPAVYAARTTICDETMRPLAPAPHFRGPFGFRNALIQACLPGNTMVVNAPALRLLQQAAPAARAADVVSHDWWAYQVLAGAEARIFRDREEVLFYRQHPRNVMGRNDTARARAARASMLLDGQFADWLGRNQRALEGARDILTPSNRDLLAEFGRLLDRAGPAAAWKMWRLGLYRQSRAGTAAVLAAALLGRLRLRRARTAGTASASDP